MASLSYAGIAMIEPEKPAPFGPATLIAEAEGRIAWDKLEAFYKSLKIKCLNCPAAMIETYEEGAKLHGFDLDEVLKELNALEADHPFNGFPPTFGQKIWRKVFGPNPEKKA